MLKHLQNLTYDGHKVLCWCTKFEGIQQSTRRLPLVGYNLFLKWCKEKSVKKIEQFSGKYLVDY